MILRKYRLRTLFLLFTIAFYILLSTLSCDRTIPHLPTTVSLVENHSDILVPWIHSGIKNAVVVNIDAHDDCVPIPSAEIDRLKQLLSMHDTAAIVRANGVIDSCLYDISNFLTAAYELGIVKKAIWAVPLPGSLSKEYTHMPFRTCLIDSLPSLKIKEPVILTVDADCIDQFASFRCISILDAIQLISETIRKSPWDIRHVSVAYSEYGGYLPVTLRWVGNALKDGLEGKNISESRTWLTLVKVEGLRRSVLPNEMVRQIRTLEIEQPSNPWLQVYLADALFRADSVDGAYNAGIKAMTIDSGCSKILPELGYQLASLGRLNDAERYLNAVPSYIKSAAELTLALGLDRAGQTQKAIDHYLKINKQTSNYSVDILVGYGYERLGDTLKARQSYLRAVSLLQRPVSEMAGFADLTNAVAAAERFLRISGDSLSANVLRKDHRLAIYFNKGDAEK
jgi:tetratricopeptide (TPR) repeat protein